MRFPFPLRIPEGTRVMVTQPYGPTALALEPIGPNGEPHFHYGVDVVIGNDVLTYGTAIVCPFPTGKLTGIQFDGAVTTKNNCFDVLYTDPDGHEHRARFYHVSGVEKVAFASQGSVLGYIGNAGTVAPKPSWAHLYAGAHLHFEYYLDGQIQDPLKTFDVTTPFYGPDTGQLRDLPPADHLVVQLLELLRPYRIPGAIIQPPNE